MKKITFLFTAVLFAVASFFTSCTDDTAVTTPSIAGLTLVGIPTYYAGTDVVFSFTVSTPNKELKTMTVSSGSTLGTVEILETNPVGALEETTGLNYNFVKNKTSVTIKASYKIPGDVVVGTPITVKFEVTDDETSTTVSASTFNVASMNTAGAVTAWTSVLTVGAQNHDDLGSFVNLVSGEVIKKAAANTASGTGIDMFYWYEGSAKLYAPGYATIPTDWADNADIGGWATKNQTKFKKLSGVTWADITDDAEIMANYASATEMLMTGVAVNDIYVFKTAGNKVGVFKIDEITGTNNGTMKISGKVATNLVTK
jgi:hypothetical protein